MTSRQARSRLVVAFWTAVVLSVAFYHVPYGRYAIYPFTLLSIWAHEMGHGLTALLTGGELSRLEIYRNLAGLAFARPGNFLVAPALVSIGGLIGPAIAGGLVIVLSSRPRIARWVLAAVAAVVLVSVALWVRTPFGVVALSLLGLAFAGLARYGTGGLKLVAAQLIGIQLALGSLSHLNYMFTKQLVMNGQPMNSDTQNIAELLVLPYWFWGGVTALLTFGILGAAFYLAWIRPLGVSSGRTGVSATESLSVGAPR